MFHLAQDVGINNTMCREHALILKATGISMRWSQHTETHSAATLTCYYMCVCVCVPEQDVEGLEFYTKLDVGPVQQ